MSAYADQHAVPERFPFRLVRASAGTGKTFQLTNSYLELALSGADPSTLLAVTFTRKAAGEILGRVLERLAHAAGDGEKAAQLDEVLDLEGREVSQALCQRALAEICAQLNRLSVSTLDSFFHRTAGCFRLELGVPVLARVTGMDDPTVERLRQEALAAVMAKLTSSPGPNSGQSGRGQSGRGQSDGGQNDRDQSIEPLLDLVAGLFDNQAQRGLSWSLDRTLIDLYETYRLAPERAVWTRLETPSGELPARGVASATEALRDVLLSCADSGLAKGVCGDVGRAEREDWKTFRTMGIAGKLAQGETRYRRKEIPAEFRAAYEPLLDHSAAALVGGLARRTEAAFDLLERFHGEFEGRRRREGVLLYSDLVHDLAARLPTLGGEQLLELYFRLDARVTHLLIDEFQDTSLEQWSVLEPLVEEILAYSDGSRTFFCVGDVKQAIYGWRGGCADLFGVVERRIRRAGGAGAETLNESYRSAREVLMAVDAVFEDLAERPVLQAERPAVELWSEGYVRHETAMNDLRGWVELRSSQEPENELTDEPEDEPDADDPPDEPRTHFGVAARWVQEIGGAASERTIGVLVSTNRAVQVMLDELRELGVPASGEGGNPLGDDPAVTALLSAFVLADHPGDRAAAFHVVRSPLGRLLGEISGAPVRSARDAAVPSIEDMPDLARQLRERLAEAGVARTVADLSRRMRPLCSPRSRRRLEQLVEAADVFEEEAVGPGRPMDFVRAVLARKVEDLGRDAAERAVRVMTIHQAKGLEFDAVVLCELDRKLLAVLHTLDVLRPEPTAPIESVFRSTNKATRDLVPVLEEANLQGRSRRLRDDLSALYVAMTRARHAICMIVQPVATKADGSPGKAPLSFATIVREALCPDADVTAGGAVLHRQGEPEWGCRDSPAEPSDTAPRALVGAKTDPQPVPAIAPDPAPVPVPAAASGPRQFELLIGTEPGSPLGGDVAGSVVSPAVPPPVAPTEPSALPAGPALRPRRRLLRPSNLPTATSVDVAKLLGPRSGSAINEGSIVHAWLRELEWVAGDRDAAEALPPWADLRRIAVRAVGVVDDGWLRGVLDRLGSGLAKPETAAVFRSPEPRPDVKVELLREHSFAVVRGDDVVNGAYDRAAIWRRQTPAGTWEPLRAELVDFKTDRVEEGGGRNSVDSAVARYRPQIGAYREALAGSLGLPSESVRASLLFLRLGRRIDVE